MKKNRTNNETEIVSFKHPKKFYTSIYTCSDINLETWDRMRWDDSVNNRQNSKIFCFISCLVYGMYSNYIYSMYESLKIVFGQIFFLNYNISLNYYYFLFSKNYLQTYKLKILFFKLMQRYEEAKNIATTGKNKSNLLLYFLIILLPHLISYIKNKSNFF